MPATYVNAETPSQAVDLLAQRYGEAVDALRGALDRFLNDGVAPTPEIRALFRYPRLRVTYRPDGATPANPRAVCTLALCPRTCATIRWPIFSSRCWRIWGRLRLWHCTPTTTTPSKTA